jgi:hypothetical protein
MPWLRGPLLLVSSITPSAAAQDGSLVLLPQGEPEITSTRKPCPTVVVPSLECFRLDQTASRRETIGSRAPDHRRRIPT